MLDDSGISPSALSAYVTQVGGVNVLTLDGDSTVGQLIILGDITVTGQAQIHVTGQATLTVRGMINLSDEAALVVDDHSTIEHRHNDSKTSKLTALNNAAVVIRNAKIVSDDWLSWSFNHATYFELDHADQSSSRIWNTIFGNYETTQLAIGGIAGIPADRDRFIAQGSVVHAGFWDKPRAQIDGSPDVFIELVLTGNPAINSGAVFADAELPAQITNWTFPGPSDQGIEFHLEITNSISKRWGVTLRAGADVTFRRPPGETEDLYINLNPSLTAPHSNATIEYDYLKTLGANDPPLSNQEFLWHGMRLVIDGLKPLPWSPYVGNANTQIIRNSDFADLAAGFGHGRTQMYDSTASIIIARLDVTNYISRTDVTGFHGGDLNASDDAIIVAANGVTADGQIVASDSGLVHLSGGTVHGGAVATGTGSKRGLIVISDGATIGESLTAQDDAIVIVADSTLLGAIEGIQGGTVYLLDAIYNASLLSGNVIVNPSSVTLASVNASGTTTAPLVNALVTGTVSTADTAAVAAVRSTLQGAVSAGDSSRIVIAGGSTVQSSITSGDHSNIAVSGSTLQGAVTASARAKSF